MILNVLFAKWEQEKQQKREQKEKELLYKIDKLKYHITKFFEDLQISQSSVAIPAWMECQKLMHKLRINKDNPKVVEYYFRKLKKHHAII